MGQRPFPVRAFGLATAATDRMATPLPARQGLSAQMIHEEPGLFDVPEAAPRSPVIEDHPISPEQIVAIRTAFDAAGISEMGDRQEVIQSCVIRRISNIRELYSREVRQVLTRIEGWGRTSEAITGTAWDNREEETWIDKL